MTVYYVERDDLIKIGCSDNLRDRVPRLHGIFLGAEDGRYDLERERHRQFGHCRAEGEWFHKAPDLLAFVANLPEWHPPRSDLLTSREVAAMLRVSQKTVHRWASQGRLRPIRRTLGQHYRFSRQDVETLTPSETPARVSTDVVRARTTYVPSRRALEFVAHLHSALHDSEAASS